MIMNRRPLLAALVALSTLSLGAAPVRAQGVLPYDNGLEDYHSSPRYRESESHPLRIVAYVLHPIGWLAREVFFRPFSYFASSTPETRSVLGYREPYDFRRPSCFHSGDEVPDCRKLVPFNYESGAARSVEGPKGAQQQALYFPDTNFDFKARKLNSLGKAKVKQAANILKGEGGLRVVLQGHADARGTEKYNQKLGLDRAEAVKAELIALGTPAEGLSTVSFGESRPLFNETEEWAYAANRRVEVQVDTSKAAK